MKFKNHLIIVVALGGFFLNANSIFAQGSLTPPGAPAPTMKTADQIEPRTIVNAANTPGDAMDSFIISKSGSYYLTTNLVGVSGKNGIQIAANNVTLDLNGFALQGDSSPNAGIYSFQNNGCTNLTIRNGAINNWGGGGVYIFPAMNCLFEGLNVSSNAGNAGITMAGYGVIRNCNSSGNNGSGFNCDATGGSYVITGCTAQNNTLSGFLIGGTISDCNAQNNVNGIYLDPSSTASNCRVVGNHSNGILVQDKCRVSGNLITGNTTAGDFSGAGIHLLGSNSRIEDNHLTANAARGIWVDGGAQNIIIKNSVIGSGANNYSVGGSDIFGPILNNSSSALTNSSPWGNFSL